MRRRVVITGMGWITPLGHDLEAVWTRLTNGESGVGPIERFDASTFPTTFAASVRDYDYRNFVEDPGVHENAGEHTAGNVIEANVFKEFTIEAADVGKVCTFAFQAKLGALEAPGPDPVELLIMGCTGASVQLAVPAGQGAAAVQRLRHAFATHLLEQHEDIRTIQVLLGHKKLENTARYSQVAANLLREVKGPLEEVVTSNVAFSDGLPAVLTGTNTGPFTLTDGALRMLVVLHFHGLGYSPLDIALLFLFYEIFGVVTNLLGGWLGAQASHVLDEMTTMVGDITGLSASLTNVVAVNAPPSP